MPGKTFSDKSNKPNHCALLVAHCQLLIDNARVVELVDTQDLNKLSAQGETPEVESLKFGETSV